MLSGIGIVTQKYARTRINTSELSFLFNNKMRILQNHKISFGLFYYAR